MLNYITSGSGQNQIIFIHGNSQSSAVWRKVLNIDSLKDYKLIAMDLPGHGQSFKSLTPEIDYSLKGMANHVLKFLKEFENQPYLIIGNSLGSNIIGEIANQLKNCKGILITGSCAIGKGLTLEDIFLPNPNSGLSFIAEPLHEQLDMLINDLVFQLPIEKKTLIKTEFLNTDPLVRTQLAQTFAKQDYIDELQLMEESEIPLAFVFGKEEKLSNINHLDKIYLPKWKNKAILIENSGHFSHLDQPIKLSEIIKAFAVDCFKS